MPDQLTPGSTLAELPRRYASLYAPETLRRAWAQVQTGEACDYNEADAELILQQVGDQLHKRAYQPSAPGAMANESAGQEGDSGAGGIHDLVVRAALATVLTLGRSSHLPPALRSESAGAARVAEMISSGLTRAFTVQLVNCYEQCGTGELVKVVRRRREIDPELLDLLDTILAALPPGTASPPEPLGEALMNTIYEPLDHVLGQIQDLGQKPDALVVGATRGGNELIVLSNPSPRNDWVLAAARDRLRTEFSQLDYDLTLAAVQEVDLAGGSELRAFGCAFRLHINNGVRRVDYRPSGPPDGRGKRTRRAWAPVRLYLQWLAMPLVVRFRNRAGGRGLAPFRIVTRPALGIARALLAGLAKLHTIELSWRLLPALGRAGFVSLKRGLRSARQRKGVLALRASSLAALALALFLVSDIYSYQSGERAATGKPAGFFMGQVNTDPPWGIETIPYGIYIPPHFKGQPGPFPLVVFLHGYGQRATENVFVRGIAHAIRAHFGGATANGPFPYIALFPIDPEGSWSTKEAMRNTIQVLDHVTARHRIDPNQVYLTGISNGGTGVWRVAEAYPDRWAAVAPVSSFYQPSVQNIKHIPSWIHHGALDKKAPAKPDRLLYDDLKAVGADVQYTEYHDLGHTPWIVFNSKGLYDWFATKRRPAIK